MSRLKKINSITSPLICQADNVAVQHEQYVDQFVTRGRQELYNVLANMYAVCLAIEQSNHKAAIIELMRKTLRQKFGIKTSSKTASLAVAIRYITHAAPKTVCVYKRVFSSAMENSINEIDLVSYITANGGIDKCGKAIASTDEKHKEALFHKHLLSATRHQLATQKSLGKASFDSITTMVTAADVNFVHLLCRTNAKKGELEIVSAIYPSSSIEQMALDLQVLCCRAASIESHVQLHAFCKENSLNVDLVHRWMSINCITNSTSAKAKLDELKQLMPIQQLNLQLKAA